MNTEVGMVNGTTTYARTHVSSLGKNIQSAEYFMCQSVFEMNFKIVVGPNRYLHICETRSVLTAIKCPTIRTDHTNKNLLA